MTLHNTYLVVLSGLFVVVFAIMIHSLARHAQSGKAPAAKKFGGPLGRGQWLWALVPVAIVVGVDLALIDRTGLHFADAAKAIAVAAAPAQAAAGR